MRTSVPERDTYVTDQHKIMVVVNDKKRMVKAKYLPNIFTGVQQVKRDKHDIVYNIILATREHKTMLINNIECETLHPCNPLVRDNHLLTN